MRTQPILGHKTLPSHKKLKLFAKNHRLINISKRGLRANGLSLLPLALRPGLVVGILNPCQQFFSDTHRERPSSRGSRINARPWAAQCPKKCWHGLVATLLAIIGCFLFQNSYTNDVSAASLTLTIPSTLSLDISNPSASGELKKSSAATASIKTDAPAGYTLSIKAKNSNELVNGSSKLTSISSAVSESDFSSKGSSNTWGYIPSKLDSKDNTNFQPGPTTTATTIDKTSSANSSTANNYTFTLGAKVNSTTTSGTYTNTFVLTSTANTISYNITYNLNPGSWSGTSPQTGSTTASSITLDSHSPTKSGYTFKGWCSESTTNTSCSGDTYQPGGTYPLSKGAITTLYAMWQSSGRRYTITYTSDLTTASNLPATQSGTVSSPYSIQLSSTTPSLNDGSLNDFTFTGWCTSYTSGDYCNNTSYQKGQSITIENDNTEIALHAMWKKSYDCTNEKIPSSPNSTYGGKRWTTSLVECTWTTMANVCPSGYRIPTKNDFDSLISSVGSGSQLNNLGWNVNNYKSGFWSSTKTTGSPYELYVEKTKSSVINNMGTTGHAFYIRCISN